MHSLLKFRLNFKILQQPYHHLRSAELLVPLILLAPPPCRAGPSLWLALWHGMVSHWLSGHFLDLEYSPRNSFSNLKQHYLAALGLGALLSSPCTRRCAI